MQPRSKYVTPFNPKSYWVKYLPEVLRNIVLQLAFHQMPEERLHLVEYTIVWIVRVVIH